MELVEGRSLKQVLEDGNERFTENECKQMFMQLLKVIEYLQDESKAICHRDINPNNVMVHIDENRTFKLTLIDFNVAKRFID